MATVELSPTRSEGPRIVEIPNISGSVDPTGTARIRELLIEELRERWATATRIVKEEIQSSIVGNESETILTQIRVLRDIVRGIVDEYVFEEMNTAAVEEGRHWTATYMNDAIEASFDRIRSLLQDIGFTGYQIQGAVHDIRADQTMQRDVFLEMYLALREIRSATVKAATTQAERVLRGNEDGEGQPEGVPVPLTVPETLIASVVNRFEYVGENRSETAANTETVSAVNAIALAVYTALGLKFVGGSPEFSTQQQENRMQDFVHEHDGEVSLSEGAIGVARTGDRHAELELSSPATRGDNVVGMWQTAQDSKVCALCRPLNGRVYKLSAIAENKAPTPPLHPNCRCLIIPIRVIRS